MLLLGQVLSEQGNQGGDAQVDRVVSGGSLDDAVPHLVALECG